MIADPVTSYDSFYQLLTAGGLGAAIGFEREIARKDASLRTFTLICLGSCLFSVISVDIAGDRAWADPGRVAAQIVTGIGFLGAGAIFRSKGGITGLTTGALMWVTAAIGMAVGFDRSELAYMTTFLVLLVMTLFRFIHVGLQALRGEHSMIQELEDEL